MKTIHILLAGSWLGTGICLVVIQAFMKVDSGGALLGADLAAKFLDDYVIIPTAMGTLVTALLYSLFTNWGWIKHRWLAVKWVICVVGIIFGTFWLGPWMNTQPPISAELGLAALNDPTYTHARTMDLWWGLVQISTLGLAVWLSIFKPWKARRN